MRITTFRRLVPALLVLFGIAGCARTGPALPDVEGDYRGAVSVQGESIPGTLDLRQDGATLRAVFRAPAFELVAEGEGVIRPDGTARLVLAYDLQCPGEAVMSGVFTGDGERFEGEIRARDCTGEIPGTFSFSR